MWCEWKRILHRTSILLMQVLKRHHRTLVSTYKEEIERIESTLKKRADFAEVKDTITCSITMLEHKLTERKQKKLSTLRASNTASPNRACRRKNRKRKKHVTISEPPASTATTTQSVILLSSVTLSEAERSLLGRGLSFCPTPPRLNTFQLQYDLNIFYRRLRLREYFFDDNSSERHTDHNPFRLRNKRWMPPKNRQPALETYIQAVDDNSKNWSNRKGRDNLIRSERKALHSLRKRIAENEIVIKPADKGSATVVMSFEYYVQEAERQLSNTNHYHPLDCDPTPVFTREVNTLLLQMRERNAIDEATQKYLHSSNTCPARFYLLPKVHKPGNPGRPIISSMLQLKKYLSLWITIYVP